MKDPARRTPAQPWTEEEVEILRELARHQLSALEVAKRTGRSLQAIKMKARYLGLRLR